MVLVLAGQASVYSTHEVLRMETQVVVSAGAAGRGGEAGRDWLVLVGQAWMNSVHEVLRT